MEHQREALDRLLPTIRAAADPIMRELYLKTVSERTGVSREVLQQQAAVRPAGSASGEGQPRAPEAGPARAGPGAPRTRSRRRHEDLSAERDLLRVLMRDQGWLARAAEEVPPEWFETPPLREVYESLRRSPENVGSGLFLEQLSPTARRAWAWLDSIEAKYGSPDPDLTYVGAVRTLEVRPLRRRRAELTLRLRQAGLAPEEQDALIRERRRLDDEIS